MELYALMCSKAAFFQWVDVLISETILKNVWRYVNISF